MKDKDIAALIDLSSVRVGEIKRAVYKKLKQLILKEMGE
jgi:hypothetical protein